MFNAGVSNLFMCLDRHLDDKEVCLQSTLGPGHDTIALCREYLHRPPSEAPTACILTLVILVISFKRSTRIS